MFCVTGIYMMDDNSTPVFIEETPGSPDACRPVCIILGKETAENLGPVSSFQGVR